MREFFIQRNMRGVSALEVVIGVSIAALILIYSSQAIGLFLTQGRYIAEKTQALHLAEDGLELVRYIRDTSWATIGNLSVGSQHYIGVGATSIGVTTTPETIGIFNRSFTVSNVYRDASDDIVASTTGGSVADSSVRYVTVTVSWGTPTTTISLSTILANLDP